MDQQRFATGHYGACAEEYEDQEGMRLLQHQENQVQWPTALFTLLTHEAGVHIFEEGEEERTCQ